MTRDQMIAEFGAPGVENPAIVDLITLDPSADRVVLAMLERRPWENTPGQFRQIEDKINRYLGYVLDGHLGRHYPQYAGKRVRIRLDCARPPSGEAVRFITAATQAIGAEGIEFAVNVIGDPGQA
jgi:hypothetical protein